MSEKYIPPKEISFRILGFQSNCVLFSRGSQDPTFWHYPDGQGVYDDQWWNMIPGEGAHAGLYLLKSKYTGKVIYSRSSQDPRVGHVDGDGKYGDNWFYLELGEGRYVNHFRIRNHASDTVLVSRRSTDPEVINYPGNAEHYADQYFSFLYERTVFDRIEYHMDQAKFDSSTLETMGKETNRNPTSTDQNIDFTFSKSDTVSFGWDFSAAVTIDFGGGIQVGIPEVASGDVKSDLSTTLTVSSLTTISHDTTFSATGYVAASAHTKVTATGTMTKSSISVPFTLYAKIAASGRTIPISGTYHGARYWEFEVDFQEESL
jgi:hypothetical protein